MTKYMIQWDCGTFVQKKYFKIYVKWFCPKLSLRLPIYGDWYPFEELVLKKYEFDWWPEKFSFMGDNGSSPLMVSDMGFLFFLWPQRKSSFSVFLCFHCVLFCLLSNDKMRALMMVLQAQDFRQQGTKMRRKMWLQNMKIKLIVLGILIALILIIVLSICGGFNCWCELVFG